MGGDHAEMRTCFQIRFHACSGCSVRGSLCDVKIFGQGEENQKFPVHLIRDTPVLPSSRVPAMDHSSIDELSAFLSLCALPSLKPSK